MARTPSYKRPLRTETTADWLRRLPARTPRTSVRPGVSRQMHWMASCRATPAAQEQRAALRQSVSAAGGARTILEIDMRTATSAYGYKRLWLRFFNCTPSNKALQA